MAEWIMSAVAHSSWYVQKARLVAVSVASAIVAVAVEVAARVFEVVP